MKLIISFLFQTFLSFPIAQRLKTQVLSKVTHMLHHLGPACVPSSFQAFEHAVSSPLRVERKNRSQDDDRTRVDKVYKLVPMLNSALALGLINSLFIFHISS